MNIYPAPPAALHCSRHLGKVRIPGIEVTREAQVALELAPGPGGGCLAQSICFRQVGGGQRYWEPDVQADSQGFSVSEILPLGSLGVCSWWEVGRECSTAKKMFEKSPNLAAH